jgi:fatty acid synthase subunit alpha, fungi type
VEALVDYIYMTLCLDLDYIIPFAAVLENGWEINGLDNKSELACCKVDLAAALEFDDF